MLFYPDALINRYLVNRYNYNITHFFIYHYYFYLSLVVVICYLLCCRSSWLESEKVFADAHTFKHLKCVDAAGANTSTVHAISSCPAVSLCNCHDRVTEACSGVGVGLEGCGQCWKSGRSSRLHQITAVDDDQPVSAQCQQQRQSRLQGEWQWRIRA